MFALLKVRKKMPKTMSILKSANKNVSWKNQASSSLSFISKPARTILNVLKIEESIFCTLTLVKRIFRPSFKIYSKIIVLTLLPELIKV